MSITAAQLRAARELIGWSRAKLAKLSKAGNGMITDFETDRRPLSPEAIAAIVAALAAAGVVFDRAGNAAKLRGVSGEGVRAA
jgi:transcriptional regulator with XRE-family HTH domain